MKFTCTRDNLVHALDAVGGISSKQTNLPILENILFQVEENRVICAATNLELAISSTIRAKVESVGSFTVPGKTLADYVHLLKDGQIDISLSGNEMTVSSGNSSTKIKGVPADDFPVLPSVDSGDEYTLLSERLRESLSTVAMSASKNDIRPELSGVCFSFFGDRYQGLVLAATDSYRLAEKKVSVLSGTQEHRVIVPIRTVYEIIRLLGVSVSGTDEAGVATVTVSENQFVVKVGTSIMISRLVEGKYPDYTQIIPAKFQTNATFPTDVMTTQIKAASLFSTTGVNGVSFSINGNAATIGVASMSTQKGEHASEVDAEVDGEDNSILLNYRYLLDGLGAISGDATFSMNMPDAPCQLRPKKGDDFLYIIMPIRQ